MADDAISEEGRRAVFEQWEKLGLDQIRADLQNGIWRVVGGTQAVRELAWEWVRLKEAEQAAAFEAITATLPVGTVAFEAKTNGLGRAGT
jgi:hypothetical protein